MTDDISTNSIRATAQKISQAVQLTECREHVAIGQVMILRMVLPQAK